MSTSLAVVRLDSDLPLPSRAHSGDAGIDLYSAQDVELGPGQR
ncbi:dUTP diphosphatase, partial [Mycobacterium sp. ITM-2017-0098]